MNLKFWLYKPFVRFFLISFLIVVLCFLVYDKFCRSKLKDKLQFQRTQEFSHILDLLKHRYQDFEDSQWVPKVMDREADILAQDLKAIVTFTDQNGKVVGDSGLSLEEIKTAESIGFAKKDFIKHIAINNGHTVRIETLSQLPYGHMRIVFIRPYDQPPSQIRYFVFFVIFSILGVLYIFVTKNLYALINGFVKFSEHLVDGQIKQDFDFLKADFFEQYKKRLLEVQKTLKDKLRTLKADRTQLKNILEGIAEGVLVTDGEGHIVLVNQALKNQFQKEEDHQGEFPIEYLQNNLIHKSILRCIKEQKTIQREINVKNSQMDKIFYVYVVPLFYDQKLRGSVSVFHDMTKIRQLENMRKDFVANVSHEFKTPLTSIIGYSETLRSLEESTETESRFLLKIERNAKLLKNLVDDVLRLSQIESQSFELNFQKVNIVQYLKGLVVEFKPQKSSLNFSSSSEEVFIMADAQALSPIFSNLISNAVKYTEKDDAVNITVAVEASECRVTIQDFGCGIPKECLDRIFERFFRVDKSRSRDVGGTGLGLAIVKHLVQAHGWSLHVDSELGQGSHFEVKIPLV